MHLRSQQKTRTHQEMR